MWYNFPHFHYEEIDRFPESIASIIKEIEVRERHTKDTKMGVAKMSLRTEALKSNLKQITRELAIEPV